MMNKALDFLKSFFGNSAFWVLVTAAGFFWLSVWLLGTPFTRNAVDLMTTVVGSALAAVLLPPAYARWRAGGSRGSWKMLMGNALMWAGIVAAAYWAFAARLYDRPQWMIDSPLNGFWRYWIVWAGILTLAALRDEADRDRGIPQSRIYYLVMGFAAGAICVAALSRVVGFT